MRHSASRVDPQLRRWQRIDSKLNKPKRKRRAPKPWSYCSRAAREVKRHLQVCYGGICPQLPDDDAGREDAALLVGFYVHTRNGTEKAERFLAVSCGWMPTMERTCLIEDASRAPPPRYTADQLARLLGVTYAERQAQGYRLIGAIDKSKAERKRLRQARRGKTARQRAERGRRAKGAKPREQYLTQSLARTRPWEAEGISRGTWYRRHGGVRQVRAAKAAVRQVRSPLILGLRANAPVSPRPEARATRNGQRRSRQHRKEVAAEVTVPSVALGASPAARRRIR
jgi:hypothetical protein